MSSAIQLLEQYGLLLVFANVLLEQAGLPIPAYPLLIVAGALSASGQLDWQACLLLVVLACLITDSAWYLTGARYGATVLRTLCRVSLSPDSCVRNTEDRFLRWGAKSLLISKFIPGFNTIAPPMAGAIRLRKPEFLFFSMGGSLLWGGSALLLGTLFRRRIDALLDTLATMGSAAAVALGSLLLLFIAWKAWQRQRFLHSLRMARITVDELAALIDNGGMPVIVDARSLAARELEPPMPQAIFLADETEAAALDAISRDQPVIVYCNCPNEASAAEVAKVLMRRGFTEVRPLVGGLTAWSARRQVTQPTS
ncbi:sulfurtransferase [Oxalobacteraceae bacterium OM1]|nr:sulfurtransferase [Oxalobacteraceae bacterium OM1]